MLPYLYFPFIVINMIAFGIYGFDKAMAIKHNRRVPEKVLLLIGLIGGAFGALAGMIIFRHKIRHKRFWLILILCALFYLGLFFKQ